MDPKFLEELQKLKEQKNADLDKNQDLEQLSIPDFEDVEIPEEDLAAESEEESSGGTIKFQRVSNPDAEKTDTPSSGRRGRKSEKPVIDEETKQKRSKIKNIVLISVSAALATIAILLAVFFGVRQANRKNYSYQFWGMGLAIDNGVNSYTFFGNLKAITQYGEIGQVEAMAEFEKGNCVRETAYTPEGEVDYYYAHQYDNDTRIMSSYHEDGQMIKSVKYTATEDGKIQAEATYYLEESRVETSLLTLSEDGNLQVSDRYEADGILVREQYQGTLVTEILIYNADNTVQSRTVYEYNDEKQLLTETKYDAQNNIQSRVVNQYNEKNLLTKTLRYNGQGDILDYDTYNYDLNDNPIKQVNYSGDGTLQYQILKVFNDKNRVTKETSLKSDGSIEYCYGYDYDEKGYISKSILYNTENSTVIEEYTLYTRNQTGSIIEANTYNTNNILIKKVLYNNAGFMTELYAFKDSGMLTIEQKYKYDEKQRLTQKSVTNFSDTGEKTTHFSEQYNEKGQVTIRINENEAEELYEQLLFQYNQDGWKEQETLFDESGKTVYDRTFDKLERIISETLYESGREVTHNEYTYDNQNRLALKSSLDILSNILINTSYTYDSNGVLISTLDLDSFNILIAKKEYDQNGLVTVQINYNNSGEVEDYYHFEYDKEGRVIVQENYGDGGNMIGKTVYYYREDGGYDYTIYDESGLAIEDSRGPEFLPEIEEEPDIPTEGDNPTTNEPENIRPNTNTSSNSSQNSSSSSSRPNSVSNRPSYGTTTDTGSNTKDTGSDTKDTSSSTKETDSDTKNTDTQDTDSNTTDTQSNTTDSSSESEETQVASTERDRLSSTTDQGDQPQSDSDGSSTDGQDSDSE